MTRAEICIPRILKHEGGFVNHPNDPGGATNKGITIATFRRYIKPNGTVGDLRKLTTAQAVVVYKRQYWDAVTADLLPVGLDYAVADFAVNSGPSRAARFLQEVVGAKQDGKIGPNTIEAARRMSTSDAINRLCDNRMSFLKSLRHWPIFGRGWTARVEDVRTNALRDATRGHIRPVEAPPADFVAEDTLSPQKTLLQRIREMFE